MIRPCPEPALAGTVPVRRRVLLPALCVAVGCAAGSAGPPELRLGAWRRLPVPLRAIAMAWAGETSGSAWFAGEGKLRRCRLKDGAILEERAVEAVQDGLAVVDGRLFVLTGDRLMQLEEGHVDLAFPLPARNCYSFAVDRRRGTLFAASGGTLYRRTHARPGWEEVGRAGSPHGRLCPRVTDGVLFSRAGVYRQGEGFAPFGGDSPVKGVFGAWQSPSDPDFLLLAAYPAPARTSDRGRTLEAIPFDPSYPLDPCGRERAGRRSLFLQTNSGKSSLGAIWGTSSIWTSVDGGASFLRLPDAPNVALALEATDEGLLLLAQDGSVWLAPFEAE